MSNYFGIPSSSPTKYTGPNVSLVSQAVRNRSPTGTDIRQGTTGKYYPIGSYWIVSKDPTTGTEGDLWYLSKIVSNVAYWIKVTASTGDVTGPGTSTTGDLAVYADGTGKIIKDISGGPNVSPLGIMTNPRQCAFNYVMNSGTSSPVTGDGTGWYFGTTGGGTIAQQYDQSSNVQDIAGEYTFTAPVSGVYSFTASINAVGISGANTGCVLVSVFNAGGTARMVNEKPAPYIGDANLNGTAEVYLAATETAKLAFLVYGGSKVVSISGTTTYRTYWAGHLVC